MVSKSKFFAILLVLALLLGQSASLVSASGPAPEPCKYFYGSITHAIDGTRLGFSHEFPLIAEVYYGPNSKLLTTIDLSYGDVIADQYLRGDYLLKFYSVEMESYIDSMEVSAEIPGCVKAILQLRLFNGVPGTRLVIREMVR